jgi:hypothetical protein
MSTRRYGYTTLLGIIALCPFLMSCAVAQERIAELDAPLPAGGGAAPASPAANGTTDNKWHFGFLPYLWFTGMHGTTGIRGFDASVHASPGDLLSHLDVGLMAGVELQKSRAVMPVDMVWARLSDDKSLPENIIGINSIDTRVGQFILTPKAGYRIIDRDKFKVDALGGMRYWHLSQKMNFNPMLFNGLSTSQDWVDVLGGARFVYLPSPKVSILIAGDGGGGVAAPDYQIVGVLGYKVKKSIILQAGWRYLDVDYRNSSSTYLYDVIQSGAAVGATFYFK